MKPVPASGFHVHALSRSGHFAVASWMVAHLGEHSVLSTALWKLPSPGICYRWRNGELDRELRALSGRTRKMVCDCEDHRIEESRGALERWSHVEVPMNVHVIRDPWNLLASRLKMAERGWPADHPLPAAGPSVRNAMLDHYVHALLIERQPRGNEIVVRFESWARDAGYREQIGKKLGLRGDFAAPWDYVPPKGNGSSWDGTERPGRELSIVTRFREYVGHPRMRELGEDRALMAVASQFWERPS